MINRLRKRMIWISGTALMVVFIFIFLFIYVIGTRQLNITMDMLTDRIAEGGGEFLPFDKKNPRPPDMERFPDFFTEETPFSTRFFVVRYDDSGNIVDENIESVFSVSREAAREYAETVLQKNTLRGWIENYRYRISDTARGKAIVFVDGSVNQATAKTFFLISGSVLVSSLVIIMFLIILLSKRAVRPMAESYEKQKQFVTDANHELKTPLTLILTNLEILEAEVGKNEWLDDIRTEGRHMSALVNQLTALSRLDEEQPKMQYIRLELSEMIHDIAAEFAILADRNGLAMRWEIQPEVYYNGDEAALHRMAAILLDNAVKYCDYGGSISLSLSMKKHPVFTVENSCRAVDSIELGRLFDRFYRADKARTANGSFGIGLSLAQSIVHLHKGEISAYKAGTERIGFKVILK